MVKLGLESQFFWPQTLQEIGCDELLLWPWASRQLVSSSYPLPSLELTRDHHYATLPLSSTSNSEVIFVQVIFPTKGGHQADPQHGPATLEMAPPASSSLQGTAALVTDFTAISDETDPKLELPSSQTPRLPLAKLWSDFFSSIHN